LSSSSGKSSRALAVAGLGLQLALGLVLLASIGCAGVKNNVSSGGGGKGGNGGNGGSGTSGGAAAVDGGNDHPVTGSARTTGA
jgi:hypothetical protein